VKGSLKEDLSIAARGVLMGSADVVPGVSGGTIALIVGIYERLVSAIAAFDARLVSLVLARQWKEALDHVDFRFLAALGTGIAFAIVSLAKLITWLILNKPIPTWSFFFGLILASAVLVYRQIERWRAGEIAAALAGAAFAFWISGLLPAEAPHTPLALFLSGSVAICAMILPGISGSFILVLLGQYLFVLDAIHERKLGTLIVFAAGCGTGLIAFTKLLKVLLRDWHAQTMAFLCGLMLGSLRKIWPFKIEAPGQELLKAKHRIRTNFLPDAFDETVIWAIALTAAGVALVFLVDRLGSRTSR
jgi:putative membrane protein